MRKAGRELSRNIKQQKTKYKCPRLPHCVCFHIYSNGFSGSPPSAFLLRITS